MTNFMTKRKFLRGLVLSLLVFGLSGAAHGGDEKYLIKMPGPKPAIAKSFKDLGSNKYEFIIDSSKTIAGGKKPTFEMIKASLLKKKMITDVKGDAKKIVVTYSGDKKKFLKKVSKARIKDAKAVQLALESSVSDGGVRARTSAREPIAGEVKGTIISVKGAELKIMVMKKGPSGVPTDFPMMRPIMVVSGGYKGKAGQVVYFKPTGKSGKSWKGKDFKDK